MRLRAAHGQSQVSIDLMAERCQRICRRSVPYRPDQDHSQERPDSLYYNLSEVCNSSPCRVSVGQISGSHLLHELFHAAELAWRKAGPLRFW